MKSNEMWDIIAEGLSQAFTVIRKGLRFLLGLIAISLLVYLFALPLILDYETGCYWWTFLYVIHLIVVCVSIMWREDDCF